jgi:Fur family ferric uptake transcriptional regulator
LLLKALTLDRRVKKFYDATEMYYQLRRLLKVRNFWENLRKSGGPWHQTRREVDKVSVELEKLCEKLRQHEYKVTLQRQIILRTFLNNQERHLSAEDVYNLIRADHPEIGLATVYRTVELFADLEILRKLNLGDGRSRYEFMDAAKHHHHLVCLKCGYVIEFEEDMLDGVEKKLAGQSGFEITDHRVKFYGYCRNCREK